MRRFTYASLAALALAACTSSNPASPGADAASDATATCASPGAPTSGPADTHCSDPDGGAIAQATDPASCHPDAAAGDAGMTMGSCAYGPTMFGQEADDDDCKYHLRWSAGSICEGAGGVPFTVVVTKKVGGAAAAGAHLVAEVFTTTPGDAACDDMSTHSGPNDGVVLGEGPEGTYSGRIVFDRPGAWSVRFHMYEDCVDLVETSPHGHAAFRVTVP